MVKRTIYNPVTQSQQNVIEFIENLCGRKLWFFEKIILEYQFRKENIVMDIYNKGSQLYDFSYVVSKAWIRCKNKRV